MADDVNFSHLFVSNLNVVNTKAFIIHQDTSIFMGLKLIALSFFNFINFKNLKMNVRNNLKNSHLISFNEYFTVHVCVFVCVM